MKKVKSFLFAVFMSLAMMAQTPQSFKYQTVARNNAGDILASQNLSFRMTILQGELPGTVVYTETHATATNAVGLATLDIGRGTPVTGSFTAINWSATPIFLKTEIDPAGGSAFVEMGTSELLSVPYALFSKNGVPDGQNAGEMLYWNGEDWVVIPTGEHNQTLRLCNGVPTWGECRYNLTLFSNPVGSGMVNGAGQYEAGEEISVSTVVNTGWEFVNWTDENSTVVSQVSDFTYTMPEEDVTLTANYIEASVGITCGEALVDTRDGQSYTTVQIGDQCWMAENLNIGTRIAGSSNQANNGTIEKYCYGDSDANCAVYGGLYQWNEMMNYTTTAGVQGICPEGWHLPTDSEWCTLEQQVDPTITCGSTGWRGADGGGVIKETGTTHWTSPNTGATNSSGFTALPGGYRGTDGSFDDVSYYVLWWSSSQLDASDAWIRALSYNIAQVFRYSNDKSYGFSVRCLKDNVPTPSTYHLILGVSPSGAGEVSGAGEYEAGEEIPVSATANTGWEFVNWTDENSAVISQVSDFTFTMPEENITLTANFVEETVGFTCGEALVDTRDAITYTTVQIGTQCWMAQNLNVGTRIDDTANPANNSTIEKYCYGNSDAQCDVYGGLYQWNEMMNYSTTAGVQGICPEGWHLPTDAEWCTLEQHVDPSITCSSTGWRGVDGGGKLKETGTSHWASPNTGATNSSGFTALPGGYLYTGGSFNSLTSNGFWWSSTEYSAAYPWGRGMVYINAYVSRDYYIKSYGFSVRCLKDNVPTPSTYHLILGVSPSGAGEVSGAGEYEAGEEIPVSATANTGWEFVNWTDENSAVISQVSDFTFTMPEENITLTANFVEETVGFTCGEALVDTRDAKTYTTVQIGTQCWMAENLNIGARIAGSSNQANNTTIEKYCYSNSDAQCDVYGGLYQWNEMMNYSTTPGVQGICPEGWHLPTDAEWCTITTYLDATVNCSTTGWTGTNAGGKMKETGTTHWTSPNTGATNSSGFTALPGGYRGNDGSFYGLSYCGDWWSSSEGDASSAWYRNLVYYYADVDRVSNNKSYGFSVRCLKD